MKKFKVDVDATRRMPHYRGHVHPHHPYHPHIPHIPYRPQHTHVQPPVHSAYKHPSTREAYVYPPHHMRYANIHPEFAKMMHTHRPPPAPVKPHRGISPRIVKIPKFNRFSKVVDGKKVINRKLIIHYLNSVFDNFIVKIREEYVSHPEYSKLIEEASIRYQEYKQVLTRRLTYVPDDIFIKEVNHLYKLMTQKPITYEEQVYILTSFIKYNNPLWEKWEDKDDEEAQVVDISEIFAYTTDKLIGDYHEKLPISFEPGKLGGKKNKTKRRKSKTRKHSLKHKKIKRKTKRRKKHSTTKNNKSKTRKQKR